MKNRTKLARPRPMGVNATIESRGNGLCDVGDFVSDDAGDVYTVIELCGPIQAGSCGRGDWICARVELADWSDVTDENEPTCSVTLGGAR